MLSLLSATIVFHLLILLKIIPYEIAWGGRLETDSDMYVFESISIGIILFLILILLMKGNFIKFQLREKVINGILWAFMVLFILNTIGNVFAATNFEKYFAFVTATLAVLIWLVLKKSNNPESV